MALNKYNDVFNNLQDYMLTEKNIQNILETRIDLYNKKNNNIISNPIITNTVANKTLHYFVPFEKDTLFWCLYIIVNGDVKYEILENKNIIIEKNLKIDYVQKIRKMKPLIKTYKFATLSHIENNLVNEDKIDIHTFLTLAVIENLNIFFIKNKTCFEILMNDTEQIYIINLLENGKYGYRIDTRTNIDMLKANLYQVDNISKPIKAFSSYKVQELIDICRKLAIDIIDKDTQKNKSKKDLYEAIIQYF